MSIMVTIKHPIDRWEVTVPEAAYQAAVEWTLAGANQHRIWDTFVKHGVPIRGTKKGEYPASQATTALMVRHAAGLLKPPIDRDVVSATRAPGFFWVLPIFDVDSDADSWVSKEQPAYWDGKIWHMLGVEDEAWQPIAVGEPVQRSKKA